MKNKLKICECGCDLFYLENIDYGDTKAFLYQCSSCGYIFSAWKDN